MIKFNAAPWPMSVKIVSLIATLALAGMWVALVREIPFGTKVPFAETFGVFISFAPPLILLVAALFVVRGYEIGQRELRIRRLLWSSSVDLGTVMAVWADPAAMKCSLRLWGNGGLYGVTGYYRSKALGNYRAFVTDPTRAVVLKLERRVVVISPDHPGRCVERLKGLFPRARFDGPVVE